MAAGLLRSAARTVLRTTLRTTLRSCVGGLVQLSDGQEFASDTIVWTAGVQAHPVLARTDLPLDERGRLLCGAHLR